MNVDALLLKPKRHAREKQETADLFSKNWKLIKKNIKIETTAEIKTPTSWGKLKHTKNLFQSELSL